MEPISLTPCLITIQIHGNLRFNHYCYFIPDNDIATYFRTRNNNTAFVQISIAIGPLKFRWAQNEISITFELWLKEYLNQNEIERVFHKILIMGQ